MNRHQSSRKLAREFGATDIGPERGGRGVPRIRGLTGGIGADSVPERVGIQKSMMSAIRVTRPDGYVFSAGVPHGVQFEAQELFFSHVHPHGAPAPVRRYLPDLIGLAGNGKISPGEVASPASHITDFSPNSSLNPPP